MERVPDNYDLFLQHEEETERELKRLPECSECGEKINDDECYNINGELICCECMESHKVNVEDYKE